jgi:hypothetical protein
LAAGIYAKFRVAQLQEAGLNTLGNVCKTSPLAREVQY